MKIKNVNVYGLEESIIRSGYPMQVGEPKDLPINLIKLKDRIEFWNSQQKRASKLAKVPMGSGHNNFLKGIIVQFDLQYPEYFSPQLQRYNWIDIISSQSKMHKITSRELTMEDFVDDYDGKGLYSLNKHIKHYNSDWAISKNKQRLFKTIIASLPSGYLKWMGISTNYLQLKTIYKQRKNHKLDEWKYFCKWIEELPMSELITNE